MKQRNLFIAAAFACSMGVQAQVFTFHVTMVGVGNARGEDLNQRYPGNNPPASFPPITLDTDAHTLRLPIGWGSSNLDPGTDLSSPFIDAVLYTDDGGIVDRYTVAPPYNDQGGGGVTGSFDNTISLAPLSGYTVSQQETDLRNGLWFLRLDTTANPGGEIAGQLTPVPEPQTYALVAGMGLVAFAAVRKVRTSRESLPV